MKIPTSSLLLLASFFAFVLIALNVDPATANKMDGRPRAGDCQTADCRQNYGMDGRGSGGGGSSPCAADAQRFCGQFMSDPTARKNCMQEHRTQLSPACKAAAKARRG